MRLTLVARSVQTSSRSKGFAFAAYYIGADLLPEFETAFLTGLLQLYPGERSHFHSDLDAGEY